MKIAGALQSNRVSEVLVTLLYSYVLAALRPDMGIDPIDMTRHGDRPDRYDLYGLLLATHIICSDPYDL